ncbi:hypothetical protein ES705_40230 [subsurface metagenome]
MNNQQLHATFVSDIPYIEADIVTHFTLVARDKKLRAVLGTQLLKTDNIIAVVSRKQVAKGFNTPFWQRINNKILQLQQEGKLCQQPSKP